MYSVDLSKKYLGRPHQKGNPTRRRRALANRPDVRCVLNKVAATRSGEEAEVRKRCRSPKKKKQELIKDFGQSQGDTGSPEVQIAILTSRINSLTTHMQRYKKDHSTRRGLLSLVSRRRGLLDYLKRIAPQRYLDIIARLHIRK